MPDPHARSPAQDDAAVGVLYPNAYIWLVFLAAMDVVLTWVVLYTGGAEANPLARGILHAVGFVGLILFKFIVIAAVICVCEMIGKRQWKKGRNLAYVAVAISAVPFVWSVAQMVGPYL